jgi:hypothetical protein
MVGIADLPVEIITGLKTSVQKSAADRAERAKAASSTSVDSDLTLSKQDTIASTRSERTLVSASELEDSYGVKVEENELEAWRLTPDKRAHTITIDNVHKPKHTHTIEAGDKHSHKAAVVAERGVRLLNFLLLCYRVFKIGRRSKRIRLFIVQYADSYFSQASKAAITILRPAMDLSLSVARGFHNAPKLYGDDTVRSPDKITDFKTGVTAAGREFAYGWYDGISGLVTQPLNGAKKNGVKGFLEGIGKGVGGFILKPGSGK